MKLIIAVSLIVILTVALLYIIYTIIWPAEDKDEEEPYEFKDNGYYD